MNLNILIPAADFLYSHSPASGISARQDTLVVRGEGTDELADALFNLLFTTAFCPGTAVRLIRVVPSGAKEKEQAFYGRIGDGIRAFTQSGNGPGKDCPPLSIRFLDDGEFDPEKERDRIAWAADLAGDKVLAGNNCHTEKDILPAAPGKGQWSAADEKEWPVLRTARRVHTAYTASWNSRYTENGISGELYGTADSPADKNGWYCLRSSLRMAVSIPWKLATAGIRMDAAAPEAVWRKLNEADGKIRDLFAWQEHRSWQAFMTLDGWRMPTPEEMDAYFFREGNDHRDKIHKLHPCLCDLAEDDWNMPHSKSLKDTPIHRWSTVQAKPDGYCRLDRMSLEIHHRCKEYVISDEYAERMFSLFRKLEASLPADPEEGGELSGLLRRMENMFRRMRKNETNSYAPWQQACAGFGKAIGNTGNSGIRDIWKHLTKEAAAAVERNRYRDYKEIDADMIRWLPWILTEEKIGTVWKLFAGGNLTENLLSAIILRPERLVILCTEAEEPKVPLSAFREFLARHGTGDTEIRVGLISGLEGDTVPVGTHDVADVTGSGEKQNLLGYPAGARIVCYADNDLQDRKGSPFFAPVYHPYDFALTVDEVMLLRGKELLSEGENNEMLGMEEDYEALWEARKKIEGAWRFTILGLQEAEWDEVQPCRWEIWPKRDSRSREYRHDFRPENYGRLVKTGAVRTLQDMETAGCVGSLRIDPELGSVSCLIFPVPEDGRYEKTEDNLSFMLDDPREESRYVFNAGYTGEGKPCTYTNLAEPIRIGDGQNPAQRVRDALIREKRGDDRGVPPKGVIRKNLLAGVKVLTDRGFLVPAGAGNMYRYKSLAVRRELEKEGFALEALVYYALFLSGKFDDVRSNIRIRTGSRSAGSALEDELDVLVTQKGRVGMISCKDTRKIDISHIAKARMQADLYAIHAKPILVCSKELEDIERNAEIKKMCEYLNVALICDANRKSLAEMVTEAMKPGTGGGIVCRKKSK